MVTATGMATEVGRISGMLQAQRAARTPLTRQLDRLSKQLLLVAGLALIASMAVNLSLGYTFAVVFNAAVAFAIAAVPVQLPTVVTTILAWGTQALARAGHHEAAALGRDPGVDLRDQHRQDRDAHPEPDDRGPDGRRRAPLRGRGKGLLHPRAHQPHRRAGADPAG